MGWNVANITGTAGADTRSGTAVDDVINGLTGNDVLSGLGGNDTYVFKVGDGGDTVIDSAGRDELRLDGITPSQVFLFRGDGSTYATLGKTNEGQLYVFYGNRGDFVRIENFFTGASQIEQIRYGVGGTVQSLVNTILTFTGTAGSEHLLGSDNADRIVGGTGTDTLEGRLGSDGYFFAASDGRDAIYDSGGSADQVFFTNNVNPNTVTFSRGRVEDGLDAGDLVINYGSGSSVTILDHYSNPAARVEYMYFDATGDTMSLPFASSTVPTTAGNDVVTGRDGDDIIDGQSGIDTIFGGSGIDLLLGGAGNDFLAGGTGNDRLEGGIGNDNMDGGADNDVLYGNDGADFLKGGAANDQLFGGLGDDLAFGGVGRDSLSGGLGNDLLRGGLDNDVVKGDAGDDDLDGGAGDDAVDGGAGNDLLAGGAGNDQLIGGAGNDELRGSAGDDFLQGGAGDDLFRGGIGNDTLDGGEGMDIAFFNGSRADYTINREDNGVLVIGHKATASAYYGIDVLSGIEVLDFGGTRLNV
jgi:Ca2+-binding RTX toxin-like protein